MSVERVWGSAYESEFEELIRAAKAGSAGASEELFAEVWWYLVGVANAEFDERLRGKISASDLVQETLMTAQAQISEFRGRDRATLLAWLRGILFNDLLEAQRRYAVTAKRRINLERPIDSNAISRVGDNAVTDPFPTPQTSAIHSEETAVLWEALAALDERDRLVIQLRNWELRPFREIGEAIGKTEEAARKIWTRAIIRLQGNFRKIQRGKPI